MVKTIIKRDGREVEFDKNRINVAIINAMRNTELGVDVELANKIAESISKTEKCKLEVEKIQDLVETKLMSSNRKDVAKEYIIYRNERTKARKSKINQVFMDIVNIKSNDVTRENANMNADTPAGMMMKFASETTKPFASDYLLDKDVTYAYKNGYIHPHDLDYYVTKSQTCCQHPLDNILEKGFRAGHGSSRPAQSIRTASMLACISLETAQNEMHGGQAIPAFDFYLSPYVLKTFKKLFIKNLYRYINLYIDLFELDIKLNKEFYKPIYDAIESIVPSEGFKLFTKGFIKKALFGCTMHRINTIFDKVYHDAYEDAKDDTYQAMEAFIHNMNTIHSRGGNQVVFSSINFGTDTSPEGRLLIEQLLKATYEGVGYGETAIFPIQIFKIKEGVNLNNEDPNYDLFKLACKVTAKRFFPNFDNLDAPFNQHEKWNENDPLRYMYEPAYMGCRTRVFENRHGEKTCVGRGNLSFTTINLPRLAIESKIEAEQQCDTSLENMLKIFYDKLEYMLNISKKQLLDRLEFQSQAKAKQFPLLMRYLWKGCEDLKPNDEIREVLKQGALSIGFIGLAECLISLTGKHHGESEESQTLGLEIISYMQKRVGDFAEESDLTFGLLATPAESLCKRFATIDKNKFGEIKGVTDKEYYTNSNHIPVYYKCTLEHKAKIESPYHAMTSAGHIFYGELDGDATHNPDAIEGVVRLMHKYNIGYGSVNHNRARCLSCGFECSDEITSCPICGGNEIDLLQRITGYLVGTTDRWNAGKQAELRDRIRHGLSEN